MPRRTSIAGALLAALLVSSSCRSSPEAAPPLASAGGPEQSYHKRTCYRCHGSDRSGTEMGPPLVGLAQHWSVSDLAAYLDDPAPFREKDARLRLLVDHYHGRLMRGFHLPLEERAALAQWLLRDPE